MNFEEKYLVFEKKKTKNGVRLEVCIKKDGLTFGSNYRFKIEAKNDEGSDEASTEIKQASGPPRDCK